MEEVASSGEEDELESELESDVEAAVPPSTEEPVATRGVLEVSMCC